MEAPQHGEHHDEEHREDDDQDDHVELPPFWGGTWNSSIPPTVADPACSRPVRIPSGVSMSSRPPGYTTGSKLGRAVGGTHRDLGVRGQLFGLPHRGVVVGRHEQAPPRIEDILDHEEPPGRVGGAQHESARRAGGVRPSPQHGADVDVTEQPEDQFVAGTDQPGVE